MTSLNWYTKRWRIEDFHCVLKSGCKIDKLKLNSAIRLSRVIAINMVIGWRIMFMTLLGREMLNLPANTLFTDLELLTINAIAKKLLNKPINIKQATDVIAYLDGYLNRKNDPPPGHQILWKEYLSF